MRSIKLALVAILTLASVALASPESDLLDRYDVVSLALAADDLPAAQKSATELATAATPAHQDLAAAATKIAESASLNEARKNFKTVSLAVVPLANGREGYFIMTCPMVSADWVQKAQKIHNPYMGKAMLECGFPKSTK
ncbi:hypothetical protein BH09VER1_BH09VER1_39340 [soil metagenome]